MLSPWPPLHRAHPPPGATAISRNITCEPLCTLLPPACPLQPTSPTAGPHPCV
ncbi:unnamed protein product, partial [Gulo gulo]